MLCYISVLTGGIPLMDDPVHWQDVFQNQPGSRFEGAALGVDLSQAYAMTHRSVLGFSSAHLLRLPGVAERGHLPGT